MENVKIFREKSEDGQRDCFTVTVQRGGYSVKQRFNNMESAYNFIKDLENIDDAYFNRKETGVHTRKHRRIHSLNMISYDCVDENGKVVSQGMGRTLNISEGGILLETIVPVDAPVDMNIAIGMKDEMVIVKARAIHCKKGKKGFESGIEFKARTEEAVRIIRAYIQALKEQDSYDGTI